MSQSLLRAKRGAGKKGLRCSESDLASPSLGFLVCTMGNRHRDGCPRGALGDSRGEGGCVSACIVGTVSNSLANSAMAWRLACGGQAPWVRGNEV